MVAVPAQIPDEFGPGPIEGSVLRFLQEYRLCVVWERQGKIKTDHLLNILFLSFYIMFIFFSSYFQNSKFVNGITSFECIVMPISWVKLDWQTVG